VGYEGDRRAKEADAGGPMRVRVDGDGRWYINVIYIYNMIDMTYVMHVSCGDWRERLGAGSWPRRPSGPSPAGTGTSRHHVRAAWGAGAMPGGDRGGKCGCGWRLNLDSESEWNQWGETWRQGRKHISPSTRVRNVLESEDGDTVHKDMKTKVMKHERFFLSKQIEN